MPRFALSCFASILLGAAGAANAQSSVVLPNFPTKPVKMQVGAAPGGGSDTLSREFATVLTARWPVPMVVENIAGAQGAIAHRQLASSPPDGYTMQLGGNGTALLGVFKRVPFDPRTAFDFIAQVSSGSYLMLIDPKIPVSNVREFVSYAKARPGRLDYGSTGAGGTAYMATEYFKNVTGIFMVHIPYKGLGPAMADVISSRISFLLNSPASAASAVKSGKIKAIAVTGSKRLSGFPDLPTVAESGFPDYSLETYYGVIGPAGIPADVLNFLNREIVGAANSKGLKDRLEKSGTEVMPPHSPAQFKAVFVKEYAAYDKLIKEVGIKLE